MRENTDRRAEAAGVDVDLSAAGYRWVWTSPAGVTHFGQTWYERRAHALAAGLAWLDQQTVGRRPT